MKYIEHFEDGYSVEHSFGDPNPDTGNSDSMSDWDNGYECGKEDGKAERTKEVLAIVEEMIEELRPRKGFEVLGLVHGAESIQTLEELKARIGGSDD